MKIIEQLLSVLRQWLPSGEGIGIITNGILTFLHRLLALIQSA